MNEEEEFDDDFSEHLMFPESPEEVATTEENAFEIVTMEQILQDVYEGVEDLRMILNLPSLVSARMLLSHYKWNKQQLIDEYYDIGADAVFQLVKLKNPFNIIPIVGEPNGTQEDCQICYVETEPDELYNLACRHKYCKTCWNAYLTEKIANEGLNEAIVCPEPTCGALVDDEDVFQLVVKADVIQKYHRSITNSYVLNNETLAWCPYPGCEYAAKKLQTVKTFCSCLCGFDFCVECLDTWHKPVTCIQLKQFKSGNDAEMYRWIQHNTKVVKFCPNKKCGVIIEKNGGCNHMTCRSCAWEFCWICSGMWKGHTACNRFDDTGITGNLIMARYKHFNDRFITQLESLRIEAKIYKDMDAKIAYLRERCNMTNNELKFYRDAVVIIRIARRVLTYTFVFAYFLVNNNHVEIFIDNQTDLENAVERLSEYLEEDLHTGTIDEFKQYIIETGKYCEQRCQVLMDHIREAEEKHLWEVNEQ
ncbi:potential E3 ubiquitin-protein ligase ariadne-1-like [Contarinia nasturtii]|uniref:potential E3 ubiquitin-protein ligase ariadne-1-like n=1 Tax=Contarinia nasturtii TaxID=265458 RepID=UPI0012D3BCBB|nr:potential E3 ubiquitin-protein ligase ariadne-1-like [Contarinia nasturtii]